jgi:hypothetical protein
LLRKAGPCEKWKRRTDALPEERTTIHRRRLERMDRDLGAQEKRTKRLRKEDEGCKRFAIPLPKDKPCARSRERNSSLEEERRDGRRKFRRKVERNERPLAVCEGLVGSSSEPNFAATAGMSLTKRAFCVLRNNCLFIDSYMHMIWLSKDNRMRALVLDRSLFATTSRQNPYRQRPIKNDEVSYPAS